ncbi:zona pellucida-like domain-containing protein 1 isoform X2 [Takifugu flavidus]|uniref:zona pellucida-like domain-containing protein 1 isoform X2 n=1 Tax=Takifugu flavidus TaxID=433684 RepID=UPI002544A6B7|nr:zona pellucida-like domain-containing protein 1 isoform X2 [Takifugu flavidus]
MRLVLLVYQLCLVFRAEAQLPDACIRSNTNRDPENSDISVVCGTQYMDLSIYICPVYHARYNESLMAVNNVDRPECYGTAVWNVDPPLLTFRFPINESAIASCNNMFTTINKAGTGQFADFSNVQYVNISGVINSIDPSLGMITYSPQILYKFSCLYPMQYLLNNTEMAVSGISLAIKDSNGTFSSTLSMELYQDQEYQQILSIPPTGLNLKTKIYVAVTATNLTNRFNVLLDRCYATTSPNPNDDKYYDLFVGCTRDAQTKLEQNGEAQSANFSFEAFRFVEHKNQPISTFYLHCITRLCEVSSCASLKPNCPTSNKRRKREAEDVSANTTITSHVIIVGKRSSDVQTFSASNGALDEGQYNSPLVAVIVCIVILTIFILAMAVYFGLYVRRRKL